MHVFINPHSTEHRLSVELDEVPHRAIPLDIAYIQSLPR